MTMTLPLSRTHLFLVSLAFIIFFGIATNHSALALEPTKQRRVLSRYNRHNKRNKVRGGSSSSKDDDRQRRLKRRKTASHPAEQQQSEYYGSAWSGDVQQQGSQKTKDSSKKGKGGGGSTEHVQLITESSKKMSHNKASSIPTTESSKKKSSGKGKGGGGGTKASSEPKSYKGSTGSSNDQHYHSSYSHHSSSATKSMPKSSKGSTGSSSDQHHHHNSYYYSHHSASATRSMKSMKQSMKASAMMTMNSDNIFDHEQDDGEEEQHRPEEAIEREIVPVQCGTDESPFLTTFVTSIQLYDFPSPDSRTTRKSASSKQKSSRSSSKKKKSGGKKSNYYYQKSSEIDVDATESDDEQGQQQHYQEEVVDSEELPYDRLTVAEQRTMERTFRNVYNNISFIGCDGFFRTVYSVSMTLVIRDEEDDEYSVTLENTYRSDGPDDVEIHVTNGTMAAMMVEDDGQQGQGQGRWRRRLIEFDGLQEEPIITSEELQEVNYESFSDEPFNASSESVTMPQDYELFQQQQQQQEKEGVNETSSFGTPTKDDNIVYDKPDSPITYAQTVSGGNDLPIYYVSLAATCRNCEVTDEVNFPLLMNPDDDDDDDNGGRVEVSRQGEVVQISAPVDPENEREKEEEEEEEEDVCTCPLPVEEEDNKEEIARRHRNRNRNRARHRRGRRQRRRRRLDGHDLYVPPPNGPTADEFIAAMNAAIRVIQETQGQLKRVAGIVALIEPDYFQGENPELVLGPTAIPTISPMPTISAAPTPAPSISSVPTMPAVPSPSPTAANDDQSDELTRPPTNSTSTGTNATTPRPTVPQSQPPRPTTTTVTAQVPDREIQTLAPSMAPTSGAAATCKWMISWSRWWGLLAVPAIVLLS